MKVNDRPSTIRFIENLADGLGRMTLTQGHYKLTASKESNVVRRQPTHLTVDEISDFDPHVAQETLKALADKTEAARTRAYHKLKSKLSSEPGIQLRDYQKAALERLKSMPNATLVIDGDGHQSQGLNLEQRTFMAAQVKPKLALFELEQELGISKYLKRREVEATTVDFNVVGSIAVAPTTDKPYGTRERRKQVVPKIETQIVNSNPKRQCKRKAKKGRSK